MVKDIARFVIACLIIFAALWLAIMTAGTGWAFAYGAFAGVAGVVILVWDEK